MMDDTEFDDSIGRDICQRECGSTFVPELFDVIRPFLETGLGRTIEFFDTLLKSNKSVAGIGR